MIVALRTAAPADRDTAIDLILVLNHFEADLSGDRKREVFDRARKIAADLRISLEQLPEAALRFTLSHAAVSTVIPGMRSVKNAEANCRAGDGKGLPEVQVSKLRPHRWIRNYYRE